MSNELQAFKKSGLCRSPTPIARSLSPSAFEFPSADTKGQGQTMAKSGKGILKKEGKRKDVDDDKTVKKGGSGGEGKGKKNDSSDSDSAPPKKRHESGAAAGIIEGGVGNIEGGVMEEDGLGTGGGVVGGEAGEVGAGGVLVE